MRALHRARGFSLLELIVAIALGTALLGALFGFFWQLLRVRETLTLSAAQHREASLVIERLERDLMTVVTADADAGGGVRGEATGLELLARGVSTRRAAEDAGAGFGNLQACTVRFDPGRGRLTIGGGDAGESTEPSELSCVVESFRLRYHDGTGWREAFDSTTTGHLPVAVEIAIWFADETDEAEADADAAGDDESSAVTASAEADEAAPDRPPDRFRVIAILDGGPAEEDDDAR